MDSYNRFDSSREIPSVTGVIRETEMETGRCVVGLHKKTLHLVYITVGRRVVGRFREVESVTFLFQKCYRNIPEYLGFTGPESTRETGTEDSRKGREWIRSV